MSKKNYFYFVVCSVLILSIIYGGYFYNIYIHPTIITNSLGQNEIILFGDFKYIFKVVNCHNLGFEVYSSNECYRDYYGSFLYGPILLLIPEISEKNLEIITFIFSTTLIFSFVYFNLKLIKPNNFFTYFLMSIILFNPTTLFIYEKLNIDLLIYIVLILTIYYIKKDHFKICIISILTLIKFYPAIFGIIFLIRRKKITFGFIYFCIFLSLIGIFLFFFWDNLLNVLGTSKYVSQSFKYSFSLNSLSKIFQYIFSLNYFYFIKGMFIAICLFTSLLIYKFFLYKKINFNFKNLNTDSDMFIVSSSLIIVLYLIFGNNFYREIYLIGIVPFLLKNFNIKFFRFVLYLFIFKYIYLLIFFPFYYNLNLKTNILSQLMVGFKSTLDFCFIIILSSILIIFIKIYFISLINHFKSVK